MQQIFPCPNLILILVNAALRRFRLQTISTLNFYFCVGLLLLVIPYLTMLITFSYSVGKFNTKKRTKMILLCNNTRSLAQNHDRLKELLNDLETEPEIIHISEKANP